MPNGKDEGKSNKKGKESQPSSRSYQAKANNSEKKSHRGKKSHSAAHECDMSEDKSSDDADDSDEETMLSRKDVAKSTSDTWAVNTGASSSTTDQLHLFEDLK
ncbi:hypothetical protein E4U52_002161 [Claviceps spartinae]|nr:hypothetical protein E4U52_002161 [Claviceps spartinae]